MEERKKCAPETCPILFPSSCGVDLISAQHIADLAQTTLTGGIWVSLIGDSIMRGVFLKAVLFLTIRSSPIYAHFNLTTYHHDHYVCCDTRQLPGGDNAIDNCAMHLHKGENRTLPDIVAAEFLSRRRRAAAGGGGAVPVCVSWQWNKAAAPLPALLDQFEAAYAATGVRPANIAFNPGLHDLVKVLAPLPPLPPPPPSQSLRAACGQRDPILSGPFPSTSRSSPPRPSHRHPSRAPARLGSNG